MLCDAMLCDAVRCDACESSGGCCRLVIDSLGLGQFGEGLMILDNIGPARAKYIILYSVQDMTLTSGQAGA